MEWKIEYIVLQGWTLFKKLTLPMHASFTPIVFFKDSSRFLDSANADLFMDESWLCINSNDSTLV